MTTTDPSRDAQAEGAAWLADAGTPGQRWFALSGVALALETTFTIGGWAGLAWLVQGAMDRSAARQTAGLTVFAVAAMLALVHVWAASKLSAHGARVVADRTRLQLARALLPETRPARDTEPAEAGLAMVDLVDSVADYHAQVTPKRRATPLSMFAVLAVTAVVHWPAAVVLVLSTALIPLNMRLAGLFAHEGAERQLAATQRLNAAVLDSFRGMQTLRELGAVSRRQQMLSAAQHRLNDATMSVLRRTFLSGMIMDIVVTFSIAANATYVGLSLLGYVHAPDAPRLTLFTGLLVLLICPMYFAPMRAAAAAFHQHERAATAAAALSRIAAPERVAATHAGRSSLAEPIGVVLSAIRYRYEGADHDTITADADITPGTWTVVAGASGSGKTTLLSLIAGMRQPSGGNVWLRTSTMRQPPTLGECAWIGQQTVLLDATVRENVRLGRSDATEQQVRRVVVAAGLDKVVERLPNGLETRLGEGGWGISTGEARRIAIARALLRGARLWLLDEPTAHLDADSEREVIGALRRATQRSTVIVATHSFALTAVADTVLAIEDGVLHEFKPVTVP